MKKILKKRQFLTPAPIFEELEPRLLFSADGAEALAAPVVEQTYEEPVVTAAPEPRAEVVSVDQPAEQETTAAADSPAVEEVAPAAADSPAVEEVAPAAADTAPSETSAPLTEEQAQQKDVAESTGSETTEEEAAGENIIEQQTSTNQTDGTAVNTGLEQEPGEQTGIVTESAIGEERRETVLTDTETSKELVLINDNVQDYEELVDDIGQTDSGERSIEVVVLDDKQDGITQVNEILHEHNDLDAVHFITHSSDGFLQLGSTWYTTDSLDKQTDDLSGWSQALDEGGDLLFYGCNLAQGENGKLFVDTLAELTGLDVAASDDMTGSAEHVGDWDLEYTVGTVDATSPFTSGRPENWDHALVTYTVTNTNDSGTGSLRQAINDANNNSGSDTITFNIDTSDSGYVFYEDDGTVNSLTGTVTHTPTQADTDFSDGWYRIQLSSALPGITDAVIIDGWSQPGYSDHPVVELGGGSAGAGANGLRLTGGDSTIRGLVINNFDGDGLQLETNGNNTIVGNYIGTDVTGTVAAGVGIDAIYITTSGNTIGGSSATDRNIISNNQTGITFDGSGAINNTVFGNYIGTDVTGSVDFGNNANGILITNGAGGNTIGGSGTGQGNVISGNTENGIDINGEDSDNTIIQNNRIGISADGTAVLANDLDGILIENGADGTIIGGTGAGEGNSIGGNGQRGIEAWGASSGTVIQGNSIGTDQSGTLNYGNNWEGVFLGGGAENNLIGGTTAGAGNTIADNAFGIRLDTAGTGNSILGNSIYDNSELGIDFRNSGTEDGFGVTANDTGDGDTGTNNLQNYPVLSSANGTDSQVTVAGTLNSTANSYFRIEFFANTTDDTSGHGEGRTYLGFANVATDSSGDATIDTTLTVSVVDGAIISATATKCDSSYTAFTDTSEFAQNVTADINYAPTDLALGMSATGDTMVNTTTASRQGEASITSLTDGGYVVVWESWYQDGDVRGVFGQRYDSSGNVAGSEFQINTTTASSQWQPAVAGTSDGGFVVTWASSGQDSDGSTGIYAQAFDSSGNAVNSEFQVTTNSTDTQQYPDIAAFDSGGYVITWTSEHAAAGNDEIYLQRFDASHNKAGGETLVNTFTTYDQQRPQVTTFSDDSFLVVWQSWNQDGQYNGVYGQRFDSDGSSSGAEFRINTTTAGSQWNQKVTELTNGGFVVAWYNHGEVAAQIFDAQNTTLGGEIAVNTNTANDQGYPSVAALADGGFLVAWQSDTLDGSPADYDVLAQRFDAAGNKIGDEFRITGTTAGDQKSSELTILNDGRVVAVWQSPDGDDSGIYSTIMSFSYVPENAPNGTVVGTVVVTDQNVGDTHTFIITADSSGGAFQIDANTGQVTVADGSILEYNAGLHTITVDATESEGLKYTEVLQIAIADVNEAPTAIALSNSTVDENTDTSAGYSVGSLTTTDEDAGDSTTYNIVGGADAGKFTIGGVNSDELILSDGVLNFEAQGSYHVTVEITDSGGLTYNETLTILVNDLNEAPVANNNTYTIDEDTTLTTNDWHLSSTDWLYRQEITLDNSGQTETLSDFAVLVKLDDTRIDYAHTQDNGADLRFFDVNGTLLDYEIEKWDETAVTGVSSVWVKVPQIDAGTRTSIWMYYGNNGATSGETPASVWDSNYVGVWHLGEEQTGTGTADLYQDSTANSNNGYDNVAATDQNGAIGDGQQFSGAGDSIEIAHNDGLNLTDAMTLSFWINPSEDSVGYNRVIEKGTFGYQDSYYFGGGDGTNDLGFYLNWDGDARPVIDTADNVLTVGNWHQATVTLTSSGEAKLFLDGAIIGTGTYSGGPFTGNTGDLHISFDNSTYDFAGNIDEVRISNTARSDDWVTAQYLSMSDSFASFGGEETTALPDGVRVNDIDVDGDGLNVTLVTGPTNGSFSLNADGSFSYTPDADWNGTDSFTYTANDGTVDSNTSTVTITVNPINDAPIAVSDRPSLNFDGVDDYIQIMNDPGLVMTDTLTLEVWVNPDEVTAPEHMILNKEGEYELAIRSGTIQWGMTNTDPGWSWHDTGSAVSANQWTHIAFSYNNDVANVYVNGALIDSYDGSGTIGDNYPSMNELRIGGRSNNPDGKYFDGQIADVRVWNTVRSQTEISANQNATLTGSETGLVGYWLLNDGSSTIAIDRSPEGNDGLLGGGIATQEPTWSDFTVDEDGTLNVSTPGILINDFDADGDTLTVNTTPIANVSHGSLSLNGDGSFDYTPDADFNGIDSFTYEISDGNGETDTTDVTISVNPVNDAPVLLTGTVANLTVDEDSGLTSLGLGNVTYGPGSDSDESGQTLTYAVTVIPSSSIGNIFLADDTTQVTTGSYTLTEIQGMQFRPTDSASGTTGFQFNVYDDGGTANGGMDNISQFILITVNPVNDEPLINNLTTSVAEDAANTTSVTNINEANTGNDTDLDGEALSYSITAGNADGIFAINGSTGEITVTDNTNLDYETTQQYVLTVQASDGTNNDTAAVTIDVTNVNDNAPVINDLTTLVAEDAANTTVVTNIDEANTGNDTDLDGEALTYSITAGNGDNIFAINATTGEITVSDNTNLDYETTQQYVLTIQASDGTNSDTAAVTIDVTNVNDNNPLINDATTSVAEDAANTTSVTNINEANTGNDTDLDGEALSYSITAGNADGIFAINGSTGEITVTDNTNLDYETTQQYVLTIQASDGTNTDTAAVTIDVTNVNDNAPLINDLTTSVSENAANTTVVTNINEANTGNDTDLDDEALTYSITAGNGDNIFAINATTGEITVSDNINLDYETTQQYVLTVQASDSTNNDTAAVTIDVTNVNDNAPLINDLTTSVAENAVNTTSVTNINEANTGNDTDLDGEALTYSITAGNGDNIFAINATTGEITVPDNTNLDYETTQQYVLTVQASDGTNNDTAAVTIDVTNVNDNAPLINDLTTSVAEDAANTTSVTNINEANTGNDTDLDGEALTYSITAGNGDNIFAINGTTGEITVTDNTNLNYETTQQYVLTVQASDGTNNDTAAVTIDVTNVNDNAPLINDLTTSVAEDAANTTSVTNINEANTGNDTDLDGEALTYSITAGNGDNIFAINAATGEITVSNNSNLDYETTPQYVLTVQASDGTNSDTAAVTIDVTNVSEAPTIDSTAVTAATEDTAYSYTITTSDPDAGATLTITDITLPSWLTLTDNGDGTATLTGTPTNADVGDHNVSLQVSDGSLTDTQSFTIIVANTNDAPVAAADTVATTENAAITIDVLANDTDLDTNDTLTVSAIDTTGTNGTIQITNSGADVSYDPGNAYDYLAVGETTTDTFSYTVDDGNGETDTATVTITVTGAEDASVITGTVTGAVTEGNIGDAAVTATGTIAISDVDADDSPVFNNLASTTGDNSYGSFVLISGTWTYTLNQAAVQDLDAGDTVNDTITYTATDGSTQQISVTITGAEEASVTGDTVNEDDTEPSDGSEADSTVDNENENTDNTNKGDDEETILVLSPDDQEVQNSGNEDNRSDDIPGVQVTDLENNTPENQQSAGDETQSEDETIVPVNPEDSGEYVDISNEHDTLVTSEEQPYLPLTSQTKESDNNSRRHNKVNTSGAIRKVVKQATQKTLDFIAPPVSAAPIYSDSFNPADFEVKSDVLRTQLDGMHRDMDQAFEQSKNEHKIVVYIASGMSASFAVGAASYLLRAGSLMSSFLATVPLWKSFDPIAILGVPKKKQKKNEETADENAHPSTAAIDQNAESMFVGKENQ